MDIDAHLARTSRTFALAIPLLEEPCRSEVGLAYLLLRIADTFEDAASWPRAERIAALEAFDRLLSTLDLDEARALGPRWVARRPATNEGYLDLLADTAGVLEKVRALEPAKREAVVHHVRRTTQGMARVVASGDETGRLAVRSLQGLRDYCYIVAGIVGELLTDLFLLNAPLAPVANVLRTNAAAFGEGLQLVNILKDAGDDARDGRSYLPSDVPRASVFDLAWSDLAAASTYVQALEAAGAPRGMVAFTALPVLLARASLEKLVREGSGAKVPRAEVARLMARMHEALDARAPVLGPMGSAIEEGRTP